MEGRLTVLTFLFLIGTLKLSFTQADSELRCNSTIVLQATADNPDTSKSFHIPNYPTNHTSDNSSCWFTIKAGQNEGIKLQLKKFSFDEKVCDDGCCFHLQIGTGLAFGENRVHNICGSNEITEPFLFNENEIWLNFHSDSELMASGFNVVASPIQLKYNKIEDQTLVVPRNEKGLVPNNVQLRYQIRLPEDRIAHLYIKNLNLEEYNNTCFDYIMIDEALEAAVLPEKVNKAENIFCGDINLATFTSKSNVVNVYLKTDESQNSQGFEISYKTVKAIYNESGASVVAPDFPVNITYKIQAPPNHVIDIQFTEFNFGTCKTDSIEKMAMDPEATCKENNDYLMISNGRGDFNQKMFDLMNKNATWTFCDCNRITIHQQFISMTNEIEVKLFTVSQSVNQFNIIVRHMLQTYNVTKQVQILQGPDLHFIGGYMLRVEVPANQILRLFGQSIKCSIPSKSIIMVEKAGKEDIKFLGTTFNSNSKSCQYLFDVVEPEEINAASWFVSWYFQLEKPYSANEFDISWKYMNYKFLNQEKGVFELPPQVGFNISEEVPLHLESSTSRKYLVQFPTVNTTSTPLSNVMGKSSYVKMKVANKDTFDVIPNRYFADQKTAPKIKIDTNKTLLKIKRNDLVSMRVLFNIDVYYGDCSFDETLCQYQKSTNDNFKIEHRAKYNWNYDSNDNEDYYLSIAKPAKSAVKKAMIDSPFLVKRNISDSSEQFNMKVYSLSFSFMPGKSSDALELYVKSERPEMRLSLNNSKSELIKKFTMSDGEPILAKTSGTCSAFSFSQPKMEGSWFRVKDMQIFSCYDFKLGFQAVYGQEVNSESRVASVGIDDINIEQKDDVEQCEKNICGEHGSCFKFQGKPVCCCKLGYEGETCEITSTICQMPSEGDEIIKNDLCQNNSTCVDSLTEYDYSCTCNTGYTGKNCEILIDSCESSPCLNGAKCFNEIGAYSCICSNGYSGKNCEIKNDLCAKCINSSCYIVDKKSAICVCNPGFTGDNCGTEINECDSAPCAQNGTCVDKINAFECICPQGFTGKVCEVKVDNCKNYKNLCQNGGICESTLQNVTCKCQRGYTGEYCETMIDNCVNIDCHGGKCVSKYLDYECECPLGKTGKNCETVMENPCQEHECVVGACVPLPGKGYKCLCNEFYTGILCDTPISCNKTEFMAECNENGTQKVTSFGSQCKCKCKTGYYGEKCEFKEDLCLVSKFKCQNGGTCISDETKARCLCAKGFIGEQCEVAINYCKDDPCEHGKCRNQDGSYKCICAQGWVGEHCEKLAYVCNKTVDCVGENSREAINFGQGCFCLCKDGFTGAKCESNIDDCNGGNMQCKHGKCVDLLSSYKCECDKGYTGHYCETELIGCQSNPCNHGTCSYDEVTREVTCECDRGFTGKFCETKIDHCASNPCNNGGTCHDLIDNYYCYCTPEYLDSPNCNERRVDPCVKSPCLNNATCMSKSRLIDDITVYESYTCQCTSSFTGVNCETLITPCLSSPCTNFGTCVPRRDGDYDCRCFPTFGGKNCEILLDLCEKMPCQNNGTCYQTPEGFKCECPFGFEGVKCEEPANFCRGMKCMNGGSCVMESGVPRCSCPSSRFIGTRCEIDLEPHKNISDPELKAFLEFAPECNILGNNPDFLMYILAALAIFLILLIIITTIYCCVSFKLKKMKNNKNFN